MASILHVFDIAPGVDALGRPVQLSGEIDGALLMYVQYRAPQVHVKISFDVPQVHRVMFLLDYDLDPMSLNV